MPYQVKLADSNCALIGTSLDLEARVKAARTEEEWKQAGKTDGIQVWRVEQFKIKPVPLNDYGTFFDGDSYIVLRTIESKNDSGESIKSYDIHFWLGKCTSIDEQGVAAYKTVELDDYLGTLPKQHREVQSVESKLFLSYFKQSNGGSGIRVLHGGVATGFNHVDQSLEKGRRTASDTTRLWHVKGRSNVRVYEVKPACGSLNKGDAFILDALTKIFVWVGPKASIQEKFKCATIVTSMQDDRSDSAQVFKVGEGSREDRDLKAEEEFFSLLKGSPSDIQEEVPDIASSIPQDCRQKRLFKVSDSSGELLCTLVAEGDAIKTDLLKGEDVFILDVGNHVYIWVGEDSSKEEKSKAMPIAMKYVSTRGYLPQVPITRVADNLEDSDFLSYFSK